MGLIPFLKKTFYILPYSILFYDSSEIEEEKVEGIEKVEEEKKENLDIKKVEEKKENLDNHEFFDGNNKYVNNYIFNYNDGYKKVFFIKNTSNIFTWNGLNSLLFINPLKIKSNNENKNLRNNKIEFSLGSKIFEILTGLLSFSYIYKTKKKVGVYWKLDFLDNYCSYHNFNEKCTRGIFGIYVGIHYPFIATKKMQLCGSIGIGMCLQRFYSLCLFNYHRYINVCKKAENPYYMEKDIINKYKKDNKEKVDEDNGKEDKVKNISNNENKSEKSENKDLNFMQVLTDPNSYYNTDLIVDWNVLTFEFKNGFFLNINWKIGLMNTYLIFKHAKEGINKKPTKGKVIGKLISRLFANVSINIGGDINKKKDRQNDYKKFF